MKKAIILLIAVSLVFCVFLGSTLGKTKEVTITYLSWQNESAMKPILDGFSKKYPNIKVDLQFAPPVKDYVEKLKTMLLTDSAPDVFMMALENREDIMKGKYALDLTSQPFMKAIPDYSRAMYGENGKAYSMSVAAWVGGIYYNKALFKKAGITKEPETWNEFLALCKKLKDAGIQPFLDNCQDAAVNIVPILFAAETYAQNPNFTKQVYAGKKKFADGWAAPLTLWYNGMVKNGYMTPDMVGITNDQRINEFATEKVAMILGGPWNIPDIEKINPKIDYKMMYIPGTKPNNKWYAGCVDVGFSIYRKTKYKAEALKFLEYISSPAGLEAFHKGTGQLIIAKGYTPPVPAPLVDAYKNGLLTGKNYIPMGEWHRYTEALRNQYVISMQDCFVGKITPAGAAKTLDAKLREMKQN